MGNDARKRFIPQADAQKIIDACPDNEWKTLIALARFGGLRTPSETHALKVQDIDWEHNRIRVTSPKTEHHEGHGVRIVPLFPELAPYLLQAVDDVPDRAEYLITKHRGENLRTTMEKIIARAKIEPYPKPFHNLRASRQTELAEHFPAHVVCAWLGNSEDIAKRHYLQVRDADYERAITPPAGKAVQNPVQTPSASVDAGGPRASEKPGLVTPGPSVNPDVSRGWALQDSNL